MLARALFAVLLVALTLVGGCANLTYYFQSVRGQLDIWSRQRDIQTVLASEDTPAALREKLRAVLEIRDYASSALGLPENRSFRLYANLERPYAVWNVFAAAGVFGATAPVVLRVRGMRELSRLLPEDRRGRISRRKRPAKAWTYSSAASRRTRCSAISPIPS